MAETPKISLPRRVITGKARVTDPGFAREKGRDIRDSDQAFLNQSIRTLRASDPIQTIRTLSRYNGIFSTAVHSYVQLAMSGYKITAYKAGTHEFDPAATAAAISIAVAADTLYDYTVGYADKQSIDSVVETLLKETAQTGSCAAELVLNAYRLPEKILPVATTTLNWKAKADGTKYPWQSDRNAKPGASNEISLDIPTFFYASTHQQANTQFSHSPLEAALQTVFVFMEFIEDIYKILRRSGHSRVKAKIIQEMAENQAPEDVRDDPRKLTAYLNQMVSDLQSTLASLEPEDALVYFDSVEVDILQSEPNQTKYTDLIESFSGMMATALKSMPSTLGMRLGGSQSLSNTESLIFLKMVKAMQTPVATVMSRMLTLATRLAAGTDSYVKFEFNSIELRPEAELSAHRSVDQQIVLRALSMGHITDDEASHILGMGPRAPGAPNLSGTMFMNATSSVQPKDMATADQGANQRVLDSGTSGGSANPKGGGNQNA